MRAMGALAAALLVVSGGSWAAPTQSGGGDLSYTCNSETRSCECTSYMDCDKLRESGRCYSMGGKKLDCPKGSNKCTCPFTGGNWGSTAAVGAGSSSTPSFQCTTDSIPVIGGPAMCECNGMDDCDAMKSQCRSGTFGCFPGTFQCYCRWQDPSAASMGEDDAAKEGRTTTQVATASNSPDGDCDPATRPALPVGADAPPPRSPPAGKVWMAGTYRCNAGQWEYVKPRWVTERRQ